MRLPFVLFTAMLLPQVAAAQSVSAVSKNSDQPITVDAPGGLTWSQDDHKFTARGGTVNGQKVQAVANQDDMQVIADELVAHFRDKPAKTKVADGASSEDGIDVYRVDAVGAVTIKTKGETATGRVAVYDFDTKVLVLEGDLVTLLSNDGTVTSHRTLQYWSDQNVAVAEGDALAIDTTAKGAGRRVRADKLTAFFRDAGGDKGKKEDKSKKTPSAKGRDLIFMRGEGNVLLTTKTQKVSGNYADYNVENGDVVMTGGITIVQGSTTISGNCAIGNVNRTINIPGNTGGATSGCAPGRVRALIGPKTVLETPPKPVEAGRR